MKCPKCQHENKPTAKFCTKCRTKLQGICPECGAEFDSEDQFCAECGADLPIETTQVQPSRPDEPIIHQEPKPSSDPKTTADLQGERRIVTVMFADISGFTAMSEKMDPEHVRDLMNSCFEHLVPIVKKYSGTVDKFIGDEIMALFGAPIAHENDPERALRAALEMMETVDEFNSAHGTDLGLHFGINTGWVIAGGIGTEQLQAYSVMGDTVNLASRLEDLSERGQILAGPETYRETDRIFDFEEVGPIRLRGKAESVQVYRALKVLPKPGKVRGIEGLRAEMIGREKEFADLKGCVDELLAGRGGIVSIIGQAGVGKSRLAGELKGYIKDEEIRWLEGRCVSIGEFSYWIFIDILRNYLEFSEEDSSEELEEKIIRAMRDLFPQRWEDIVPYIGNLLSVKHRSEWDEKIVHLPPEQVKHKTFTTLRDLFVALAKRKPLILILEDLHWADNLSLDLLSLLMDVLTHAPLLLLCIYRPDKEHRSWRIGAQAYGKCRDRCKEIMLRELSQEESRKLVETLLSIENLPEKVKESILQKAEGNPFFVEEVIRSLFDSGVIYREGSRLVAKKEIEEIEVPDTIQSIIIARIDRLEEKVRYVLQSAAVIGRLFRHRLLEYITNQEQDLEGYLLQLEERDLVYEERAIPELEYSFKHTLMQETAYSTILSRRKREFHRKVGEGYEALYSSRLEEYYEDLAYHYSRSDEEEKAIDYLIKAGRKAGSRYANQEALDYFESALDMIKDGDEYDRVLGYRAKLFLELFRGVEAAGDYERLLKRARDRENRKDELEALLSLASAYFVIALDEAEFASKSLESYKDAYALALELDDKASMVRSLTSTGKFLSFWSDYLDEAAANGEEALSLSQEIGDEELIIDSRSTMINILRHLGHLEAAEEQGEELINQLESRHDLFRLKENYFPLMFTHLSRGNFERCIECCDAGIKLAEELGSPPVQYPTIKAQALLNLGRYDAAWESLDQEVADEEHQFGSAFKDYGTGKFFMELMEYEKASEIFESVIERAIRLGRSWMRRNAQIGLTESLLRAGGLDRTNLEKTTKDLVSMDPTLPIIGARYPAEVIGEIDLSEGKLEEALKQGEKACTEAEESGSRLNYVSALELRLRILLKLDKPGDVVALTDEGIRMAEEMDYLSMLWRVRGAKAQALEMLGDTEAAGHEYDAAAAVILQLADTIPDTELKENFMANPTVSSIIDESNRPGRKEVE